jgi:hypothetical protein
MVVSRGERGTGGRYKGQVQYCGELIEVLYAMHIQANLVLKRIPHTSDDEAPHGEIWRDGQPTHQQVPGAILEACVQWHDKTLLLITDDVPYEEALRIILLDQDSGCRFSPSHEACHDLLGFSGSLWWMGSQWGGGWSADTSNAKWKLPAIKPCSLQFTFEMDHRHGENLRYQHVLKRFFVD